MTTLNIKLCVEVSASQAEEIVDLVKAAGGTMISAEIARPSPSRKAPRASRVRALNLTQDDVKKVLRLSKKGLTHREIGRQLGVSGSTIGRIVSGTHRLVQEEPA